MRDPITSRRHPIVQECRRLATGRGVEPLVLLDGEHLVAEAMRARLTLTAVLVEDPATAIARTTAADVFPVTRAVMEAASPVRTPSGIVAIARWQPADIATILDAAGFVAGLVDVQDPGNVGAAIRSAHALGPSAVICLGATAHPGSWRALRAAMGSTFHVPVGIGDTAETLAGARDRGLTIVAMTAEAETSIDRAELNGPLLALFGNEGAGLPVDLRVQADQRIRIPMATGVDSLNVGAAAAVVIYEASRQRTSQAGRT